MNMILRTIIKYLPLFLLVSCGTKDSTAPAIVYDKAHQLISVDQLKQIVDHNNVAIIDFRKPDDFIKGHIPKAINFWRSDIENNNYDYGGMMPTKNELENLLSQKGVKTNDLIVIYDDKALCDASRLWWILNYYGYDHVALLEGGINAWKEMNSLSTVSHLRKSASFQLSDTPRKDTHISMRELEALMADTSVIVIDSRTPEEFAGTVQKSGAFRSGRIPGSINIDWSSNVDFHLNKFRPQDSLRDFYHSKGVSEDKQIVVYCHSGVRSSHSTYVLTKILGYQSVRNYDGSWIEWSYHKELPLEKDGLQDDFK